MVSFAGEPGDVGICEIIIIVVLKTMILFGAGSSELGGRLAQLVKSTAR